MASSSTSDHHENHENNKSHFTQTVCLADWWLVSSENLHERRLAVAGFASREKQAKRVFSSAPIVKTYDVFNLETTDGICVIIKGLINKDRTIENGFSSDVFNHFVIGFPPYWKEYYENFMGKESPSMGAELPHADTCANDLESPDKTGDKGLEKDFCSIEDHTTADIMPVNSLKSTMNSSIDSSFVGNNNISAVTDKNVDVYQFHDSGRTLSACRINTRSRSKKAADCPKKVILDEKMQDKMKSREIDTNSEKDENELIFNSRDVDKDLKKGKTKGNIQKAKDKATRSLSAPTAADNHKKSNLYEKVKASDKKTRRKLAYETPEREKEKLQSASPQSLSLNRSRSGRLLMPTLEFWRNQRAIYTPDRTVTGIEEDSNPERTRKGSVSTSGRKRRQPL